MTAKNENAETRVYAEEVAKVVVGTPHTALEQLSAAGRDPILLWEVEGPKNVPGLRIAAILCQDTNDIVMSRTLASGRFSLFVQAPA